MAAHRDQSAVSRDVAKLSKLGLVKVEVVVNEGHGRKKIVMPAPPRPLSTRRLRRADPSVKQANRSRGGISRSFPCFGFRLRYHRMRIGKDTCGWIGTSVLAYARRMSLYRSACFGASTERISA